MKAVAAVTKGKKTSSSPHPVTDTVVATSTRETGKIKEEKFDDKVSIEQEIMEKQCVVDIETLSFRPASGQRLQTARRGKKFTPGNFTRKQWTGRVAGDRNDADVELDNTPYNEWLAAQGLLNLSEDQPKQGDIRKLREDSKKKKENIHVAETDESTSKHDKQNVNLATDISNGKKDDCTNQEQVNSTSDDLTENLTINTNEPEKEMCKNVEKVQTPVQLNVQKQNTEKDENKEIVMEKRNMESIRVAVENMIKDGKGIEECVQRKETLENILAILNPKSEGDENIETKEIRKIDEAKTSEVVDCEVTGKAVALKVIIDNPKDVFNVNKEIKQEDCSDEFSSTDSLLKNIQEDISKLIDVDNSNSKAEKKSVSFEISTCAQLHKSAEKEAGETVGDDTLSVNDLVIDDSAEVVDNLANEIVDTVVAQENEVVDSGFPPDDLPSDEMSCTPPCSQIPRRDPYARQR